MSGPAVVELVDTSAPAAGRARRAPRRAAHLRAACAAAGPAAEVTAGRWRAPCSSGSPSAPRSGSPTMRRPPTRSPTSRRARRSSTAAASPAAAIPSCTSRRWCRWLLGTWRPGARRPAHRGRRAHAAWPGAAVVVPVAVLARRLAGDVGGVAAAWTAALAPGLATLLATRGAGSEAEYTLLVVSVAWRCRASSGRGRGAAAAPAGLLRRRRPARRPRLPDATRGSARRRCRSARWRDRRRLCGADRRAVAGGAGPRSSSAAARAAVRRALRWPTSMRTRAEWQLTAKSQDASIEAWHAVARGDRASARPRCCTPSTRLGLRFEDERAPLPDPGPARPGRLRAHPRHATSTMLGKDLSGWCAAAACPRLLAVWAAFRRRRTAGRRGRPRSAAPAGADGLSPSSSSRATWSSRRPGDRCSWGSASPTWRAGGAGRSWRGRARAALAASLVTFVGPAGGGTRPTTPTSRRRASGSPSHRTRDRLMTRSFVVQHFAERTAWPCHTPTSTASSPSPATTACATWPSTRRALAGSCPSCCPSWATSRCRGCGWCTRRAPRVARHRRVFALVPAPPRSTEEAPALGFMCDWG